MIAVRGEQLQEPAMLSISVPEEMEIRLEDLAKRTGRTTSFYVQEAILAYLEDIEDLYMAEQVQQRIDSGEERTSSLEDIEARLGLAD